MRLSRFVPETEKITRLEEEHRTDVNYGEW